MCDLAQPQPAEAICALCVHITKQMVAQLVAFEMGRAEMAAELKGPLDHVAVSQLTTRVVDRIMALDHDEIRNGRPTSR